MKHGEDLRMGMRWIIGRPVETLLLVFGISLGIGATAAGIALAGRTGAEARKMLASTQYREIVVKARQSASDMDRPAIVQTSTANVFLTTADLAARQESQDVQYAYVANPTGFRFGVMDFRGPDGQGGPPPQGGQAQSGGQTGSGQGGNTVVVVQGDTSGNANVTVIRQSGDQQASGQQSGQQGQQQGAVQQGGQQAQQAGQQGGGLPFGDFGRPRVIVQPPEGPQPIMEEARGYDVTPEFFTAWSIVAAQGSLFTLADVQKREPVMVLGSKVATTLYEDKKPMGRQVLSRNQLYRIVGILEPTGTDYDQAIFTPAEMPDLNGQDIMARFRGFNTNLHFTVADYTKLERAKAQLESYFDAKFGTGSAVITIPRYQAEAAKDRNTRLVTVILFLALAALVIAAANVTNILFARAIRKRRSVGILKALGASRRGVFQLFFLEAALIGVAGALVGTGLSVLMSKLMQDTMGFGAIYVSFLAAGIIGAAALVTALDIFPAMQAARVPASEAIRYE